MKDPGFVYVLSNPCMPGLVKIGKTSQLPTDRAAALFTTGVPQPFALEIAMWFPDAGDAETVVHERLESCRHSERREFFECEIEHALKVVVNVNMLLLNHYGLVLMHHAWDEISEDCLLKMCEMTDVSPSIHLGAIAVRDMVDALHSQWRASNGEPIQKDRPKNLDG